MKKQTALSLFFLFITLAGFSNARLFPGYYITLQGDSIRCNIEFNDWNLNPKTIRVEVNTRKMEFTPNDIRGFGVDGYDDYLSAKVQFHTAPVSGRDVPSQFSDSVSTKTFFLKILDRGYYSLYDLVSAERVFLFMQTKDSSIAELVYRARSNNDTLFMDPQYKNAILSLFVQEGLGDKYFNRISNTSYTASDIQSLFKMLNETHGGVSYHKKSKQDFQIQLYVGGIRNAFPTPVTVSYGVVHQFDPSSSMTGGISLLYSIPGKFNAFKVGLSAGYNSYNLDLKAHTTTSFHESDAYYGSSIIDDTLTTKNSLIQTNLYLMYLINPLGSVKCYLKAGLNFNFSLNTDNSVYESYSSTSTIVRNGNPPGVSTWQNSGAIIQLKKKYLAPLFGAGVTYGRSTLEFSYYMPADIGSEPNDAFADSGPVFKISSMSLSYYLSVFRTK
jgi:hypothetical protein